MSLLTPQLNREPGVVTVVPAGIEDVIERRNLHYLGICRTFHQHIMLHTIQVRVSVIVLNSPLFEI